MLCNLLTRKKKNNTIEFCLIHFFLLKNFFFVKVFLLYIYNCIVLRKDKKKKFKCNLSTKKSFFLSCVLFNV